MFPIHFLRNKYLKWYLELMEKARNRKIKEYTEKHHVIPRCLGGTEHRENKVRLTYKEHFIAHWLLLKFTVGIGKRKSQHAMTCMRRRANGFRVIAAWQFVIIKKAHTDSHKGKVISQEQRENVRRVHSGKIIPDWHKKIIGDAARKRVHSPEERKKRSERMKGRIVSLETRKKQSEVRRNMYVKFSLERRLVCSKRMFGNKYALGQKLSIETRAKMSAAQFARQVRERMEKQDFTSVSHEPTVS